MIARKQSPRTRPEAPVNSGRRFSILGLVKANEAITLARQYAREDIAQQEERELAILETYLPEQLNTEDLIQRIDAVIQELGATSDKDLGRVMQILMPAVKGRADGSTVNRLVRERLAGSLSA